MKIILMIILLVLGATHTLSFNKCVFLNTCGTVLKGNKQALQQC